MSLLELFLLAVGLSMDALPYPSVRACPYAAAV